MASIEQILQSVFGLRQFRPHQREIVEDVLHGHDVVCVMPTGAGKSLCYQLPAVVLKGLTIIVSPLISLMADQVHHLHKLKIPALFLNSSQPAEEQRAVLSRLYAGFSGMLYIAPERFSAPSFQRLLPRLEPKLFVVDEAHCVSFWGHDFRPEYMRLAEARRQLGSPATMAVTATATPQVRSDMVTMLGLRTPRMHVTGFDRPNLAYSSRHFSRADDKDTALLRFVERHNGSGIVYCSTRKAVEELSALLEEKFHRRTVCAYHAGMDASARRRSQAKFTAAEESIVVATNAFGMGINKPDIRFVIHYNLPGSVEAYYQEAGRAGRDGEPANCLLYYNDRDLRTQNFFIDNIGENNPALAADEVERLQQNARRKLDLMLTYASRQSCRRRQILDYFGESGPISGCSCDVCSSAGFHRYQPDLPQQKARSGTRSEAARPVRGSKRLRTVAPEPLDAAAESRFEQLRKVRREIADEHNWPAFCILHDSVLREVAREEPNSIEELAAVKGVGATKAAKFGKAFLTALNAGNGRKESRTDGNRAREQLFLRQAPVHRTGARSQVPVAYKAVPPNPAVVRASASAPAKPDRVVAAAPENTPLDSGARARFDRLVQVRAEIAAEQNYPLFCILLDETLREVARRVPRSFEALAAIQGVGPRKAARFGAAFLAALRSE